MMGVYSTNFVDNTLDARPIGVATLKWGEPFLIVGLVEQVCKP